MELTPPVVRQVSEDTILVEVGTARVLAQASCPHRKGRLRYGFVNARTMRITCPLHHSTFDLLTGQQQAGPSCGPLRVRVLTDAETVSADPAHDPDVDQKIEL